MDKRGCRTVKVMATRLYYIRATFPPLRHFTKTFLLERHRCIHRLINHVYTKDQALCYPLPHDRGYPPVWMGGILPSQVWTGGYPIQFLMGVPPIPGLDGGYPIQSWMGVTPHPRSGQGYHLVWTWDWVPPMSGPGIGYPPVQT